MKPIRKLILSSIALLAVATLPTAAKDTVQLANSVDPFIGTAGTSLPKAEGIATSWRWLKAQTGNTHPGSCYPFGMMSVTPYSGGYPTGYGVHKASSSGQPRKAYEDYQASGFTHFQQSGTGGIGYYYSYLEVTPVVGGLDQLGKSWKLKNEKAKPGYYSAELDGTGIRAELTVNKKSAFHRYTFPQTDNAKIAVDIANGGLFGKLDPYPSEAEVTVTSNQTAQGRIVMCELPIYFFVKIDANGWKSAIWKKGGVLPGERHLLLNTPNREDNGRFGVVFSGKASSNQQVVVKVGFSLRSIEQAKANVSASGGASFDHVVNQTRDVWERHLRCIEVVGGTEKQRTLFYTALYHSLIKPADFTGEEPGTKLNLPFFLDFATMWDMYKTQIPLVTTFYPETGRKIVNSFMRTAEKNGDFANAVLLRGGFVLEKFDHQAGALAHTAIADAYAKGIRGIDWGRAKYLMANTFVNGRGKSFAETGTCERLTHTLDYSYGAFCTAQLALGLNDMMTYARMMKLSDSWKKVYDPATGILIPGEYYEGGRWNYSFRQLHNMKDRIALSGGRDKFVAQLDSFFGITPAPGDKDFSTWEGMNNQSDMESPYSYIYAGRPDRTAEVVRACLKYRFSNGRGGLAGNDDSGGTSSWYVWSAMGLFPVVGQDIILIGSPTFEAVALKVAGKRFVIRTVNGSDKNIYIQGARLNGKPLDRAFLHFSEIKNGGKLVLYMGSQPSKRATTHVPPSYGQ